MWRLATLATALLTATGRPAEAGGDAGRGRQIFNVCRECHAVEAETNGIGPHLKGLIGRRVASVAGYEYSGGMIQFGAANPVWDDALFLEYISNPLASAPGSKMVYRGLITEDLRADMLAYLKSKM